MLGFRQKYQNLVAGGLAVSLVAAASAGLTACGKGKKSIPGLERFTAGVVQGQLIVSFVATTLKLDFGGGLAIPGLDGARVSIGPDLNSDGTLFQFSFELEALAGEGKPFQWAGLPDGRPLPDVVDGVLPRWEAPIKDFKLTLYLSNDAFGLYVPLKFMDKKGATLPIQVSVPIEDERGNLLGKAYAIPSDVSGSGSGLFVLLPFLGGKPQGGAN